MAAKDRYSEYVDDDYAPDLNEFVMEKHRPQFFSVPYHHHPSIEINFPTDCSLEYSFSGSLVTAPDYHLTLFWGAAPHRVSSVSGEGDIANIYLNFAQLMLWGIPTALITGLISGDVICSKKPDPLDNLNFQRWSEECRIDDAARRSLLLGEIEMRLKRLALEGWDVIKHGDAESASEMPGSSAMRHAEQMLRFIADNYASRLTTSEVAAHAGLSSSYAMTLFRKVVGESIREHLTRTRLSHAQMLLAHSDQKVLAVAMESGFRSLSSFYEAFEAQLHKTPAAYRRDVRH